MCIRDSGMAMRRLAIIDLNSGQQPLYSDDKKIALVFNGEIYNFKALREKLKLRGACFNTKSDTEVILRLYEEHGVQGFRLLDGMFGFSLYDSTEKKVFICRDYFGEKPIYYYPSADRLYIASELKSIINTVDQMPPISKEGLSLYFSLTYIPSPFTIFKGIRKLSPNSILTYDLQDHEFQIDSLIPNKEIDKIDISFDDAKKKVRDLVVESVETRSISDVPLGTFLSGGVDSSIVSLCLARANNKPIDTFSIGFEKKSFSEEKKSRLVANLLGSRHHEFIIGESDLANSISKILLNFDEPFADASALATYIVAKKTAGFVKVALTGDGGDEVFGGYNKYYIGQMNSMYTKWVPEFLHQTINNTSEVLLRRKDDSRGLKYKINKLVKSISYDNDYYWEIISLGLDKGDAKHFFLPNWRFDNPFQYYKSFIGIESPKSLTDFKTIDRHLSLEGDMLVKVDRTSMLNSLECRAPFLNKNIYDFVASLPDEYLLNHWNKKRILKEAFSDDFPKGFLEKPKKGFGIPVGDWLRNSLKTQLRKFSSKEFLDEQGIFNTESIQKLIADHIDCKIDNTFKVWAFYCFQIWYKGVYCAPLNVRNIALL